MKKVTHTTLPTIEVIENLHFNIRVRDKLLKGKDREIEGANIDADIQSDIIDSQAKTIKELEARIKAMTSPKASRGWIGEEDV